MNIDYVCEMIKANEARGRTDFPKERLINNLYHYCTVEGIVKSDFQDHIIKEFNLIAKSKWYTQVFKLIKNQDGVSPKTLNEFVKIYLKGLSWFLNVFHVTGDLEYCETGGYFMEHSKNYSYLDINGMFPGLDVVKLFMYNPVLDPFINDTVSFKNRLMYIHSTLNQNGYDVNKNANIENEVVLLLLKLGFIKKRIGVTSKDPLKAYKTIKKVPGVDSLIDKLLERGVITPKIKN